MKNKNLKNKNQLVFLLFEEGEMSLVFIWGGLPTFGISPITFLDKFVSSSLFRHSAKLNIEFLPLFLRPVSSSIFTLIIFQTCLSIQINFLLLFLQLD